MVSGGQSGEYGSTHYDTTKIFDLGSWSWREGPRLPHPIARADGMQVRKQRIICTFRGWHA